MSVTGATTTPTAATARAAAIHPKGGNLVWRRFRRHRLAMLGLVLTVTLALVTLFSQFIAPFQPEGYNSSYTYAPPQTVHWLRSGEDGRVFGPYVHGLKVEIDYESGRRRFASDPTVVHPIGFFVKGDPYKLWGVIPTQRHLFGPLEADAPMYLLGADRLGRDVLSRTLLGGRISLTIGLVGVTLSFVLGVLLGGMSGYFGGVIDNVIQRLIEFLQSIPSIPLWIGLAAALPKDIPPAQVYFLITLILAVIGWTGLARVVRGRFLQLKSEDFVKAAKLDGCSPLRTMRKHMVPSFASHIIAALTLAIPNMILAETALSFLGIGLRPPAISWGVLLQEAQNIRSVATAPWLFVPGIAVVISVLSLNFLGDGLRDAADPRR